MTIDRYFSGVPCDLSVEVVKRPLVLCVVRVAASPALRGVALRCDALRGVALRPALRVVVASRRPIKAPQPSPSTVSHLTGTYHPPLILR